MSHPQESAGRPTAFGTLHARVRSSDGAAVLVEVLDPAPYDRLLAAREALCAVQGRHVLQVLDVVRQESAGGAELCAVVRPGFPLAQVAGPLPAAEAVRVGVDVLLALADVHDAGQVHGSLDERAVLLDVSLPLRPTARVLGHGLAALLTDRAPTAEADVAAAVALLHRLLPVDRPAGLGSVMTELAELPAREAAARLAAVRGLTGRPGRRRLGRRAQLEPPGQPAGWLPPPVG